MLIRMANKCRDFNFKLNDEIMQFFVRTSVMIM